MLDVVLKRFDYADEVRLLTRSWAHRIAALWKAL